MSWSTNLGVHDSALIHLISGGKVSDQTRLGICELIHQQTPGEVKNAYVSHDQ